MVDNFRRTFAERRSAPNVVMVAISEYIRQRLVVEGYDGNGVRVLPNPAPAVATEPRPPAPGPARFLFLGRMVSEKGVCHLVEALAQTQSGCALDIAGSGPEETDANRLTRTHHLADRVTLHGWVRPEEVARLIGQARGVVVPSVWPEPAGMVAIEAAVHGRATIASSVGGLPEIVVDGLTGLLVPPGDPPALARALDRLSENGDEAAAMGAAARARGVLEYSVESHVDRLFDIYADVAASARDTR